MKFVVLSLRVPPQVISHVKLKTAEDPNGYDLATLGQAAAAPNACPIIPLDDNVPFPPIGAVYIGGVSFGPVPVAEPVEEPVTADEKQRAAAALKERRTRLAALLDGTAETEAGAAATVAELDAILETFLGKP
jgi:hypothetical protein